LEITLEDTPEGNPGVNLLRMPWRAPCRTPWRKNSMNILEETMEVILEEIQEDTPGGLQ
jgi:hypothetical protein